MRLSRYTIQVDDGQDRLLFNTATGKLVAIPKADSLDDRAQELTEVGILTEATPEEELASQQAAFDATRQDTSTLTLSLLPTYACNCRCPHCYELDKQKPAGHMSPQVMDAIMRFIRQMHERIAFERLDIQWYGGEPTLCMDIIEELSGRMISWCEERGVTYSAMILTNATLLDEAAAHTLARCRVTTALLTVEGPEDIHNARRCLANGAGTYQQILQAARYLRDAGVTVMASMNVDKRTLPLFPALRDQLLQEAGIQLTLNKLNDYNSSFGCGAFKAPDFELLTHDEFFQAQAEMFTSEDHAPADYEALMAPCPRFCTGQLDNSFLIDLNGDVFNCDGHVGEAESVRFNIQDAPATWLLRDISHDATRDPVCSQCQLLPICQGSCIWERECCEASEGKKPCHPLKDTLPAYLRAWHAASSA
ncbi:MAG: radical SAM protein [Eggerthellaceae bacterium]|nr:radical SAM protein [Eggerthellaceae bacterium]